MLIHSCFTEILASSWSSAKTVCIGNINKVINQLGSVAEDLDFRPGGVLLASSRVNTAKVSTQDAQLSVGVADRDDQHARARTGLLTPGRAGSPGELPRSLPVDTLDLPVIIPIFLYPLLIKCSTARWAPFWLSTTT